MSQTVYFPVSPPHNKGTISSSMDMGSFLISHIYIACTGLIRSIIMATIRYKNGVFKYARHTCTRMSVPAENKIKHTSIRIGMCFALVKVQSLISTSLSDKQCFA